MCSCMLCTFCVQVLTACVQIMYQCCTSCVCRHNIAAWISCMYCVCFLHPVVYMSCGVCVWLCTNLCMLWSIVYANVYFLVYVYTVYCLQDRMSTHSSTQFGFHTYTKHTHDLLIFLMLSSAGTVRLRESASGISIFLTRTVPGG
jgi:uncharacterized membrane protein